MKKQKLTRAEARGYLGTFQVGYCDLQYLLKYQTASGYNCGIYGWNFDHYYFNGYAINTGYRAMVGKKVNYKLVEEYNEKGKKLDYNDKLTYNQKKAFATRLLNNFIKKAVAV